jgi:hypothetical protein
MPVEEAEMDDADDDAAADDDDDDDEVEEEEGRGMMSEIQIGRCMERARAIGASVAIREGVFATNAVEPSACGRAVRIGCTLDWTGLEKQKQRQRQRQRQPADRSVVVVKVLS